MYPRSSFRSYFFCRRPRFFSPEGTALLRLSECAAIAAFRASGAAEAISAFLSPIGGALGIPSELFPLIISRPLSGAAANASFASLASDCGANSFEVFAAAVIMGSSDTLVYVLFVYFSQTRVKKTLYAFPAAAAVAVFSLFVSLFCARLFFA